ETGGEKPCAGPYGANLQRIWADSCNGGAQRIAADRAGRRLQRIAADLMCISKPTRGFQRVFAMQRRLQGARCNGAPQRLPKSVATSAANGCRVCPNPLARRPATVAGRRANPLSRLGFRAPPRAL